MGLGACHGCTSGSNLAFHVDFRPQIHRVRIFCGGQGIVATLGKVIAGLEPVFAPAEGTRGLRDACRLHENEDGDQTGDIYRGGKGLLPTDPTTFSLKRRK
jgi:hypothetical protein